MDPSENPTKPVDCCPECGGSVEIDILYHGPGQDGFLEYCTKCEWKRESHFSSDEDEIPDLSPPFPKCTDRDIINKWVISFNNASLDEFFKKMGNPVHQANGFIGFCYVDHDAGISYRVHSFCRIEKDKQPEIISILKDTKQDLVLRYGVMTEYKILTDLQRWNLFLPNNPEWLKYYENSMYSFIRSTRKIDSFRAPGFFDDVSVILFSKDKNVPSEVVWVRLEEVVGNTNTFRGRLLNQPNSDFGVTIGENIPVLYIRKGQDSYIIGGNGVNILSV